MSTNHLRTITAGCLLLGLGASGVAAPAPPSINVDNELKFIPVDANVIVVARLADLVANESFTKLRKQVPTMDREFGVNFRSEFGVDITNVEFVLFGGNVKQEPVAVLRLKEAVTADAIRKTHETPRFQGDKGRTFKEVKVGTYTLFEPDAGFNQAFCLLDAKTLVMARTTDLKRALDRNKKPDFTPEMQAALALLDPKLLISGALDLKSIAAGEKNALPIPGIDAAKVLDSTSSLAFSVRLGKDVHFRGIALCKDEKAAGVVKEQGAALISTLTEMLKKAPNKPPKEVIDLAGQIKLSTRGNNAEASLVVPADTVVTLLKSMMMGPAPPPPPAPPPAVEKRPAPPIEKKP